LSSSSEFSHLTDYRVVVATGLSSATDSSVFLKLVGVGGDSGEFELKQSENMNKFESGQVDTFTFRSLVALGSVDQVHVRLQPDGNLIKRSWHLQSIEVSGGDLADVSIFHHGKVLTPDNPTAVLQIHTSASRDSVLGVTKSVSRRLTPALSKKVSSGKGAHLSKDVAFGPAIQRVLPAINQDPVCFVVNTHTNTLIIGKPHFRLFQHLFSLIYFMNQAMMMAPLLTIASVYLNRKFKI